MGDTSFAFTVPKSPELLGDERLHLSNVASPRAELLGGLFKHKSCSWSTGGRWRLGRDDRIILRVMWQEGSEPGQPDKTGDNTLTAASSPSGIRIKPEFLPWDFSKPHFLKGFTALCALHGKEILQDCGEGQDQT